MADRSVTVRLTADVKPFIAAMAKAAAAAKKLRDGLGDSYEPFEKETQKQKQRAPKQAEEVAGAFARSFSRSLESAFRSLPKANITADSSDAQVKLASLRQAMQDLSDRRIGVDINAASALGELRAIQMELDRLTTSADIDIRADAGAALSQLRSVQREVDRLGGETAQVGVDVDAAGARSQLGAVGAEVSRLDGRNARVKVDADVSGALAGIALVGAALASLPAAATIGLGIGALGGAFAAAGAGALGFAAVAVPSLGRINEALDQTTSSAGGAGGAMKSAAQSAAEAASRALSLAQAQDRVKDAASAVVKAQQGVKDSLRDVKDAQDAYRSAQEAAAAASERISEVQAAGARRVADAERSLADAHRATQRAIEDLTRARERAQERIEDLALATEGGALSEERALLSIKRAQADLARVNADPKASALDKEDAALRLKEAEFNLKRIREANGDLAKEQAESDRKGIEGSDEVVAAKERILDAQRREAEAAAAVGEAQAQAARDVAAAQRDATEASRDAARAQRDIGDAQRKVADAQQAVIKAQRDELRARQALKVEMLQQKAALEQAGAAAGGGGGAASKMSELSKAERELAKDIKAFREEYIKWQQSLQPDIFPVIRSGMDLMSTGMKISTPLIKASAGAFGQFLDKVNEDLQSEQWTSFFDDLTEAAPRAIEGLGTAAGNVAGGLAGVIQAFLPYTGDLLDFLEKATQGFEDWGQNLKGSPEFEAFINYVRENGPKVGEVLSNIATFAGKVVEVGADLGPGVLDFIVGLSDKLANMDPAQVEAIAKGVAAIFAAAKLGATLKIGAFVLLAEVLSRMSPGQIEAVALAIAGVVVATKTYQSVSGAVGWYQSLAGSIDKAGKSADGAKGKFSGLIGALKAGGVAALLAGVAIGADKISDELAGLNPDIDKLAKGMSDLAEGGKPTPELLDQIGQKSALLGSGALESFAQSAARLASDNPFDKITNGVTGFVDSFDLITLDNGKQAISNIDQALATMVSQGNGDKAAQAFKDLAKWASESGVPVEKLRELMPGYTQAVADAGTASATAADGIDTAKQKLDGLQTSLDTFTGRTDYMQAIRNMETAYKDAAEAIQASSGKLDFNAQMTDKQRDAVIKAREQYGEYISKVADGATAQEKLSGRTGDATLAVANQLPKLFDLAGKSKEAREQVYQLAEKFGISRTQADKATGGAKDFRDMLAQLKSKQVQIELDTKKAREEFAALLKSFSLASPTIPVGIAAPKPPKKKALGGISHADGREYMAMGGIRSAGSSPPAMIARQPYMIRGRSGPDVVFGEAGWEAYIPLDPSKRARGLQILGEAASAMGMAVVPQDVNAASGAAGASMAGSFTGGGSLGGTMVTVTGITALQSSIDTTALGLTSSLGDASAGLDAAFGDAGAFTGVVDTFAGEVAGWADTVAGEVPPLTSAVEALGEAVSAAASAAGGDAKGDSGSKADEQNPRSAKGKASSKSKGKAGSKTPKPSGTSAAQLAGMDAAMAKKQKAKAAAEKKVGISGAASGSAGVALSGGGGTNWSRVSKPVQSSSSGSSGASSSSGGGGGGGEAIGGSRKAAGSLVHVDTLAVTKEADADLVAAQLYARLGSKG